MLVWISTLLRNTCEFRQSLYTLNRVMSISIFRRRAHYLQSASPPDLQPHHPTRLISSITPATLQQAGKQRMWGDRVVDYALVSRAGQQKVTESAYIWYILLRSAVWASGKYATAGGRTSPNHFPLPTSASVSCAGNTPADTPV